MQTFYDGDLSARVKLYAIWDDGDDDDDETLARICKCSPATVHTYRQDYFKGGSDIVEVTEEDIPFVTRKGGVWCVPVEAKSLQCEPWRGGKGCRMYEQCQEAVRLGHFVACERVLKKELW